MDYYLLGEPLIVNGFLVVDLHLRSQLLVALLVFLVLVIKLRILLFNLYQLLTYSTLLCPPSSLFLTT